MRRLREESGRSQAQLAKVAGISQPALSQIEAGAVSAHVITLHRIARALEVQYEDILRDPGHEPSAA